MTRPYDRLKATAPADLEQRILSILSKRIGSANAIYKSKLMEYLPGVHERQVRFTIASLRKQGELIASTNKDGYFMCASFEEYEYFRDSEFKARIADLSETVRILDHAAREKFGDAFQATLF